MRSANLRSNEKYIFGGVDWWCVLIYLALVFMGWISIYAAVYNEDHSSMFDIGQKYGSQVMWIGICGFVAISILLIDVKYYHIGAYPLYILLILVLLATLVIGTEVNGAKSWISLGSLRIQPAEFGKFTTALALARYMSSYSFNIHSFKSISWVLFIMGLPALIILTQNDTGSAVVYAAFFIMLFREEFNRWFYIISGMVIALFLFSFLVEDAALLGFVLLFLVIGEGFMNGYWREKIMYLSSVAIMFVVAVICLPIVFGKEVDSYTALLVSIIISVPLVFIYAVRYQVKNILIFVGMFLMSILITFSVDYVFENVMQIHQRKRILDLLGLESDAKGWGYNVNQSKIAIGSGGFSGKGFLEGTQTKFDFVPEQSTDFIFCTIGEEWGFIGSTIVVVLFSLLIYRLMKMGDHQQDPFGRVYCYSVASIFLVHMLINIGMTIGLVPVIGIPLPFFSYGGSSLLSFTILLFVAIRINASTEYGRDLYVR